MGFVRGSRQFGAGTDGRDLQVVVDGLEIVFDLGPPRGEDPCSARIALVERLLVEAARPPSHVVEERVLVLVDESWRVVAHIS